MKELNILIIEDNDMILSVSNGLHFGLEVMDKIQHSDIAIKIKKNGDTTIIKNRACPADAISCLAEELSLAYAENRI